MTRFIIRRTELTADTDEFDEKQTDSDLDNIPFVPSSPPLAYRMMKAT